ncbi:helix-turn-helix domain-containing protein [Anaerosinus massiliensis]|uniref:helix-turn-helix domain-containing protein n=1 Tax=Massilibacillus massiliensis TaxID=1806837 RepID=UPI000DA63AB0|nr:helix-turn-helix transcriptional regulator [Massilibacillus massiliensis]
MDEFPNNLRQIRVSHPDKSLRSGNKIAALLGVTPQYYYKLETGKENKRLNIDHLNQLTKIFGVTADEILGNQPLSDEPASENKKTPKDLAKFLEQTEVMFDGETYKLDNEDKAKLRAALEFGFWTAKEKNKRKKK